MSTMWIPNSDADYDAIKGFDVYSSDNEKVGTIEEVLHPAGETSGVTRRHYFKVDPGLLKDLLGGSDMYVPEGAISTINQAQKRVMLAVSKDLVQHQNWGKPGDIDSYRRV